MRISIIAVGKMKAGPERELVARYLTRAKTTGKNLGLQDFNIIELSESRASSPNARKAQEAVAILSALPKDASVIALDETGISQTSQKFTTSLRNLNDQATKNLCFIIGGADGLANDVRKRAKTCLSFSPLTWPHQIVRIMLAEQLYRATTILTGHPYHRA